MFKHWIKLFVFAGILAVVGIVYYGLRGPMSVTPVSEVVRMQLVYLSQAMRLYAQDNGPVDWPSVDVMLSDLAKDGRYEVPSKLKDGFDVWGSKIVLIKDEQAKRWILRSFGPNRRDDNGEGDDIQEEFRGTW